MKHLKFYFFILSLLCLSLNAISQSLSINILQQPAYMPVNSTGTVEVDIVNIDAGTQLLPAYRILPTITLGSNLLTITGATLPAGWFICSITATEIIVSNGSDGTLAPGEGATFFVNVQSGSTTGYMSIAGNLNFGGGPRSPVDAGPGNPGNACTTGPTTVNGSSSATFSATSVEVIGSMPIGLTNFNVMWAENRSASITWKGTGTETLGTYYILQRSLDGINFSSIAKVMANSITAIIDYKFFDKDIEAASYDNKLLYYRVAMVDNGVSIKYSPILTLKRMLGASITMGPNPIKNILYIRGLPKDAKTIIIYNFAGQEISKILVSLNPTGIDFSKFISGIYTVKVLSEEGAVLQTQKSLNRTYCIVSNKWAAVATPGYFYLF